jgi:hypothetical protein
MTGSGSPPLEQPFRWIRCPFGRRPCSYGGQRDSVYAHVVCDSVILAPLVRSLAATSVLLLTVAAFPQLAAAQDDGVFFDPGGPSDKEYAVPHEQARGGGDAPSSGESGGSDGATPSVGSDAQQGGSDDGAGTGDSADAPLFGEGVSRATGDRSADGQVPAPAGRQSVVGISPANTETNFATGLGWFAVIAAGVALAGGGLAYLFRGRPRGPA